jgi:hypothetical protein
MLSLKCYALCGFTQLCIIACPNNRMLEQSATLECSSGSELPDNDEPCKVEFAVESAPPGRQADTPETG